MSVQRTSAGNVRITLVRDFHPQEAQELLVDLLRDPTELRLSQTETDGSALAGGLNRVLNEILWGPK